MYLHPGLRRLFLLKRIPIYRPDQRRGLLLFFKGETSLAYTEGRLFLCKWCGGEELICRSCDRGQQYCSVECSLSGRRRSQRIAQMAFSRTVAGRHGNARRQSDFRNRSRHKEIPLQKVTHHTSFTLRTVRNLLCRLLRPFRRRQTEQHCCSICGRRCVPGISERRFGHD